MKRKANSVRNAGSLSRFAIPAMVVLAGILAYANCFSGVFLFDDEDCITKNPDLASPWDFPRIAASMRPVVDWTLAVQRQISGLTVEPYHLFNLCIHLLAALTLFGIVRRLLLSRRMQGIFRPNAGLLAGAVAGLWVVHPLTTEAVTYIIQRAESMMALFYLLTVYCAIRAWEADEEKAPPGHGTQLATNLWTLAAIIACALGMGSKQVMVTAPLVVLLAHRMFWADSFRQIAARWKRLYMGLAVTWGILIALLVSYPSGSTAGFGIEHISSLDYLRTQAGIILHYLRLAIWPDPLVLDYDWHVANGLWQYLPQGLVILAALAVSVTFVVLAIRRPDRPLYACGFLGAWFFLILAPTSSVMPIKDLAVEHRAYLPLAAVVAAVVLGAYALVRRPKAGLAAKQDAAPASSVRSLCIALAIVAVVLGFLTHRRNTQYASAQTMWKTVIDARPDNPRGYHGYGRTLADSGDDMGAIASYRKAIEKSPTFIESYYNLGNSLVRLAATQPPPARDVMLRDAISSYRQAVAIRPDWTPPRDQLGQTLAQVGEIDEAITAFREETRIAPNSAKAHFNLAAALTMKGDRAGAVQEYETALRLNPDDLDALVNAAVELSEMGRDVEAADHLQRAVDRRPTSYSAILELARLRASSNQAQVRDGHKAIELARRACGLKLDPGNRPRSGYVEALDVLGQAYAEAGMFPEAIAQSKQAAELAQGGLKASIQARIGMYQQGQPYRKPPQ